MILLEEAYEALNKAIRSTQQTEAVSLAKSHGRTLAQDIFSDIDTPPFNRATMDGFAVVSSDGPGEYEVIEDIPAGKFPAKPIQPGQVAKIMTGAPLPEGADAVAQVEKTGGFADVGQRAVIKEGVGKGVNVARKGEDVMKGDLVLRAGRRIRVPEVAALASMGADPVKVYNRPNVAILATGDELVDPSQTPSPGQIRNVNSHSLHALVSRTGIDPVSLGIGRDNDDSLAAKIEQARQYDFLIVSGGVSAGDRDLVPSVLEAAGYRTVFHKVRIKPGKPVLFGASEDGKYVFGVPGNPVSAMVIFELMIKPALEKFSGLPARWGALERAELAEGVRRKKADREEYRPARLANVDGALTAAPVPYHGSGHFLALTEANGAVRIPIGVKEMAAGSSVEAVFIGS